MPNNDSDALLMALTAEHAAMQGVVNASVNEQQGRASMFLLFASGSLVAIGLMAQSPHMLLFSGVVVSVVYLTGFLTFMRLVDVAMESMQSEITIAKIRGFYRTLGGAAEALFEGPLGRWPEGRLDSGHVIGEILGLLTTAASMISCVNGFIGGAGLALLAYHLLPTTIITAVLIGAAFVFAQVWTGYLYQSWRINSMVKLARDRSLIRN